MTREDAVRALEMALMLAGLTREQADKALAVLLDDERRGLLAAAAELYTIEKVHNAFRYPHIPWQEASRGA